MIKISSIFKKGKYFNVTINGKNKGQIIADNIDDAEIKAQRCYGDDAIVRKVK